jgi:acyl CoA:acetate/3-ketoacid CoA transferase
MTPNSTTPMQINMSAWQTGPNVYVQYNGGANAADLTSLNIRIISYSGNVESRTINAPVPNTTWQFTYATSNSANRVNVVGTFSSGRQQTVLFTYL